MKNYHSLNRQSTGATLKQGRCCSCSPRRATTATASLEGGTRLRFATPVLFCWALAFIAGGCGQPAAVGPSEPLVQIDSTAQFNSTVLDSRKPVIVMFYKEGCPACAKLEVLLGQLAAEYHGRAVFVKYPLATPLGIVKNRELRDKFEVYVWPTAMLFFDEREKKRWLTNDFPADVFRKDLDEILSAGKDSGGRVTK